MGKFFDIIKDAFKHASFDFYKFRDEINDLIKEGKKRGYDDLGYCDLKISALTGGECEAEIRLYYRTDRTDKFYQLTRKLELGEIVNIPDKIDMVLRKDKAVQIKIDNILGLMSSADEKVRPPFPFEKLYSSSKKIEENFKFETTPIERRIKIQDELFFMRVIFIYVFDDGKTQSKTFCLAKIINLPDEIKEKIDSSEDNTCIISV